jgi:hypothetical protein
MNIQVAQYNVHKRKDTMLLLSADSHSADLDIIAIQEPAQNPSMIATYCDSKSPFRPLYSKDRHSRVCIFINKRLPIASWKVEFPGPDIITLTLTSANRNIILTNVYSQPSAPNTINTDSPIYQLPDILSRDGDHILLGDFNLHHQAWSGSIDTRPDRMASDLLSFTQQADLELITPPGLPTWRRSETSSSYSTIDLAFLSASLTQHLVYCNIDDCLHHGSDHRPIRTQLLLPETGPVHGPELRRNWKLMDRDIVTSRSRSLQVPNSFSSHAQIDDYALYLQQFITRLAADSTPIYSLTPSTREVKCSWWTSEVDRLVTEERQARRRGASDEILKEISRRKKSAVKKAKRADWRHAVHEAKDGKKGIWGLVRWGKERSHLPPELPMVPPSLKETKPQG